MFRILLLSTFLISCSTLSVSNKSTLQNGSPISIHIDDGLPRQIVTMQLRGLVNEVARQDQAFFSVISKVFDMGPKDMTEEVFKNKLFLLNASISFNASYRTYDVAIASPPQHLAETLDLAIKTLRNPKLDASSVNEAISNTKANVQSAFTSMRTGIMYHSFKDYFQNDPLALNGTTSPKDVNSVNADKVNSIYKKIFTLQQIAAYSVGPLPAAAVKNSIDQAFARYQIPSYQPYEYKAFVAKPKAKVQVIHRPKVTDHQVLFLFNHKFDLDGREIVVAQTLFEYFGGGLTGRLGMTLREQRGLTYHASSNYGRYLPSWYIYSFAGSKQLEPLLKGVIEVKNASAMAKVTSIELANIKSTLAADFKQSYELPMDDLGLEAYADLFDLDVKAIRRFPASVVTVSESELEAYKSKLLSNNDYSLYIMGDKTVILPILKSLGYANVEVINEVDL
jgi:zinc protease